MKEGIYESTIVRKSMIRSGGYSIELRRTLGIEEKILEYM